jgi:hypothetical protein
MSLSTRLCVCLCVRVCDAERARERVSVSEKSCVCVLTRGVCVCVCGIDTLVRPNEAFYRASIEPLSKLVQVCIIFLRALTWIPATAVYYYYHYYYIYMYMYVYVYIYMYVCMYVYIHTYIYTDICIHIHIHIDTYEQTSSKLAKYAGFFYAPLPDRFDRCVFYGSGNALDQWEPTDDPWTEYKNWYITNTNISLYYC